jgi:predicted nucleic acid-binding protein
MTYVLDSNVWVALLRASKPLVVARFRAAPPADLRVCSVVVAELRYGCARSAKAAANRAAVDALLAPTRASRSTTPQSIASSRSGGTSNNSVK